MNREQFLRTPIEDLPLHLQFYRTEEWKELKRLTLERDNHTCRFCGKRASSADHSKPRRLGGEDSLDNLAAVCKTCNEWFSGSYFMTFEEKKQFWDDRHDEQGNVIRKKRTKNPLVLGPAPF